MANVDALKKLKRSDDILRKMEWKWFEMRGVLRFTGDPRMTKAAYEEMEKLCDWVVEQSKEALDKEGTDFAKYMTCHEGDAALVEVGL